MYIYLVIFFISLFLNDSEVFKNDYIYVDENIFCYMTNDNRNIYDEDFKDSNINVNVEVYESYIGKLSRYGPDCYGCSGYLAYGIYVGDGIIFYDDYQYGMVRILAGDSKFPFGTIVRVTTNDEKFIAIVLDRGGSIGVNNTFLFDLLYPSEYLANNDGISKNTLFEILRYGF